MTYPPQPPGPPGQQPGPYGGQPRPDPHPQQSSYQGLGSYPSGPSAPPPPKKSHLGTIVAITLVALLVLGGGGAGVYYLTKKKDDGSASAPASQKTTSKSADDDNSTQTPSPRGQDSPAEVQQAYIEAYQTKKFGTIVGSACDAYKRKFGTSTADLEKQLAPWEVKATANGAPQVDGPAATAKINLELTNGGETKKSNVLIKMIKESGSWKFCGEG